MLFEIVDKGCQPAHNKNVFCLFCDNWDDYTYKTSFNANYYDDSATRHYIGAIKIGYMGMPRESRIIDVIPKQFIQLSDQFFSLGQTTSFYQRIAFLGDELRCEILSSLNDVAYNLDIYNAVYNESVLRTSLMRDTTDFSLKNQLHRMAHGGAILTGYHFTYTLAQSITDIDGAPVCLDFSVIPNSNPPSNIHVLIGRNGTGKTHLLQSMINSIHLSEEDGSFSFEDYSDNVFGTAKRFANTLCVAFSPFDNYPGSFEKKSSIPYTFIGLDKTSGNLLASIEDQFMTSFIKCMSTPEKKRRWKQSIEILKSDPMFSEAQIEYFADMQIDSDNECLTEQTMVRTNFSQLSSGHKVVLSIITCCVDKLEEQSVVFMDEPENHLHPPLLSAFIRAFSTLLVDRNGVAIISTHSPVVLQEVPSTCVWNLRRYANNMIAERLPVETFGSSIGTLTSEVFGLEVTASGFHKLLSDAVEKTQNYDSIVESFENKLGNEARGILRTLLAIKKHRGQ